MPPRISGFELGEVVFCFWLRFGREEGSWAGGSYMQPLNFGLNRNKNRNGVVVRAVEVTKVVTGPQLRGVAAVT